MGNKYLETKNDTLESSILDVWKDAAKLDEYKTRLGEKKRVAGGDNRRTENKQPKEEGLESSPNAANSQHLCAKNVVHEDWGEGQPVHGMHAIPNSNGDIAWYDVMFEHGVEKGVSINELKVTKSESHHNHGGNGNRQYCTIQAPFAGSVSHQCGLHRAQCSFMLQSHMRSRLSALSKPRLSSRLAPPRAHA